MGLVVKCNVVSPNVDAVDLVYFWDHFGIKRSVGIWQ